MENSILDEALKMSPNERVALAELILESVDYEEEEVRNAWIAEVRDRISAVREGRARLFDFQDLYSCCERHCHLGNFTFASKALILAVKNGITLLMRWDIHAERV